jgi:hypothetical protein
MEEPLNVELVRIWGSERGDAALHTELVALARPRGRVRGLLHRFASRRAAMADSAREGGSAARAVILSTAIRREAR